MSLSKECKIRVLEDFYALDTILLNSSIDKKELSKEDQMVYEEYQSVKGALLSVTSEMFELIKCHPESLTEDIDGTKLKDMAKESAEIAISNAKEIITSENGQNFIKTELKEDVSNKSKVNIREEVNQKVDSVANKVAIDNLLIARSLQESESAEKLNDWEGKILEDAYKVLRDNLIDTTNLLNSKKCQN